jgi:hypothetical protein
MHLKLLEKQEQVESQISVWKEIIKIKAEINEIETKKLYKESTKQKKMVIWKDMIDKLFANLMKRREKTQINKIRDKKVL